MSTDPLSAVIGQCLSNDHRWRFLPMVDTSDIEKRECVCEEPEARYSSTPWWWPRI